MASHKNTGKGPVYFVLLGILFAIGILIFALGQHTTTTTIQWCLSAAGQTYQC